MSRFHEGLALLGWLPDSRVNADDEKVLQKIATQALNLQALNTLDATQVENLSLEACRVLKPQITKIEERANMLCGPYSDSRYLSPLLPLIDEASFAFYRGYYTVALAALYVVLERYVRAVAGWTPGQPESNFSALRRAVESFPASHAREGLNQMLSGLYSRYEALSPPAFYFNRLGVQRGIREPKEIDEMNCVRTFLLLDYLSFAERPEKTRTSVESELVAERKRLYEACLKNEKEMIQLGRA